MLQSRRKPALKARWLSNRLPQEKLHYEKTYSSLFRKVIKAKCIHISEIIS